MEQGSPIELTRRDKPVVVIRSALTLVTANVADYLRFSGLVVEDWRS